SGPVNMELNEEQQTRAASFSIMCYEGNRLLRDQGQRKEKLTTKMAATEKRAATEATTKTQVKATKQRTADDRDRADFPVGKRVSFSSKYQV
ncbi:hypothetical protein, partial [Arcticibacter sp.]|uniref:hypothetical protein n=1 Tax=Arcticibacter sp. TaxID=1872630 RepID=UPI00388D25E7